MHTPIPSSLQAPSYGDYLGRTAYAPHVVMPAFSTSVTTGTNTGDQTLGSLGAAALAGSSAQDFAVKALTAATTIKTGGYTVATLPAGTIGMTAYVTDALAPTFLATVVGGGAITTPVFYNGANWVGA